MAKLVQLCLETNHENSDGVAWYAYFDGQPTAEQLTVEWLFADEREEETPNLCDGGPLGPIDLDLTVEVPNNVSRHGNLRRFFVAAAG